MKWLGVFGIVVSAFLLVVGGAARADVNQPGKVRYVAISNQYGTYYAAFKDSSGNPIKHTCSGPGTWAEDKFLIGREVDGVTPDRVKSIFSQLLASATADRSLWIGATGCDNGLETLTGITYYAQ